MLQKVRNIKKKKFSS